MRKLILFKSIFYLLVVTNISSALGTGYLAKDLYSKMKNRVFRVRTSFSEDAPKASYGSGFVVSKDGLIVTNYHVVATSLQKFERYNVYVDIDEKAYKATVLEFDIINDIALLKVEKSFKQIVIIRKEGIKIGDKIFSMGIPRDLGLSIIEGIYNGIKKNGLYERIHMSAPLNAGMSGGPTIDQRGELVGVNVSGYVYSQNISFAVNKEAVVEILRKYKRDGKTITKYDNKNRDVVENRVKEQLLIAQDSLVTDFDNAAMKVKRVDHFEYAIPSKELKCWQVDRSDKKKNLYNIKKEICYVPSAAYLMRGMYSGTYEFKYSIISSSKLNGLRFYDLVDDKYNLGSKIESIFINYSKKKKNNFTKYVCESEMVVSDNSIPFKINYCLRTYVDYTGFYDIDLKAVSLLREKDALKVRVSLRGFTSSNISKVIRTIINKIRYIKDVNSKNI